MVRKPKKIKVKRLHAWEELLDPEGHVIRFKIEYAKNGALKGRSIVTDDPELGDIVLDLTSGIKAWKITSRRRRKHPVSPLMRKVYESSVLYLIRQYAAGKIDPKKLLTRVQQAASSRNRKWRN